MIKKQIKYLKQAIIKVCSVVEEYPITILSIYACTYFIYRDLGVRMFLGYGILALFLIILIQKKWSSFSFNKLTKIQYSYLILTLSIFFIFLRPGSRHDSATSIYILMMMITAGFLLLNNPNKSDVKKAMKVFIISALFFAIFILFFQVFKGLYWKLVYPLLTESSQIYAKKYAFRGYSVPVGGSFTYVDYILTMGLICSVSTLIHRYTDKKQRLRLIIISSILFLSVLIVGRRGEFLSLLITLCLVFILSANKEKRKKRLIVTVSSVVVIFVLILIFLPLLTKIPMLHRYTNTLNALLGNSVIGGGIDSGRSELYKNAWQMFLENPLIGVGWGAFALNIDPKVLAAYSGELRNVHNCYLQLLAETGIVGFTIIISSLSFIYISSFKLLIHNMDDKGKDKTQISKIANSISLFFQTFILLVAFLDPSIYKFEFWSLYFVCVSLHIFAKKAEFI